MVECDEMNIRGTVGASRFDGAFFGQRGKNLKFLFRVCVTSAVRQKLQQW
jgi:hypothetical protein